MRGRNFLTAGMRCTTSRGSTFVSAGDIVGHNEWNLRRCSRRPAYNLDDRRSRRKCPATRANGAQLHAYDAELNSHAADAEPEVNRSGKFTHYV